MPRFLAEMSRGISRRRLQLYPHVREVLDMLRERFPLAVVTDAQTAYARGELHKVGLLDYFEPSSSPAITGTASPTGGSSNLPSVRMGVAPENALYVGNDMYRDIFGAREAGMRTVMFESDQGLKTLSGLRTRPHDHGFPRTLEDPRHHRPWRIGGNGAAVRTRSRPYRPAAITVTGSRSARQPLAALMRGTATRPGPPRPVPCGSARRFDWPAAAPTGGRRSARW